jgi:exodeoxyribonuclease V
MEIAPQQDQALKAVSEWFNNSEEQVFYLAGYAGSGKTTLAKYFAEAIEGTVLFAAFTGKAAHVLRTKGCDASTIHSLIYRLDKSVKGKPVFVLNRDGSDLRWAKLLILDEVSMVNEELALDLLSFGKKILVLGDPGQLPPVQGTGYFTAGEPNFMLTDIHRQAKDSPIITLATEARNGRFPLAGKYGNCAVQYGMPAQLVMEADQLLVGSNNTRKASNARARMLKEFTSPLPMKGDKLLCLRNNAGEGLMNGTTWEVDEANVEWTGEEEQFFPPAFCAAIHSLDMNLALESCQMHKEIFEGGEVPLHSIRRANEFDFGYALTCHKAQGSQWPFVVVYDESWMFKESRWRWLYTAITRAAERVVICKK